MRKDLLGPTPIAAYAFFGASTRASGEIGVLAASALPVSSLSSPQDICIAGRPLIRLGFLMQISNAE
jgi:hypothetical protein